MSGCFFCGSSGELRLRYGLAPPWSIAACRTCGMWQTWPRPTVTDLVAAYPDEYAPHVPTSPARHRSGWRRVWAVPDWPRGTRILEWGSASGRFAGWAERERGWRVTPCDGIGAAERWNGEPGSYDAVVGWHVLEHTLDPVAALTRAREALRSGGFVILSVPNRASLERWVWGADWKHWDVPRHLWHFSPASLRALLRMTGFVRGHVIHQRVCSGLQWHVARDLFGALAALLRRSGAITVQGIRP